MFEQLSGLKIIFHKSEIFCFGKAKDMEIQYRQIFGCEVGTYQLNIWEYRCILENLEI
jgi:hypothetical protein